MVYRSEYCLRGKKSIQNTYKIEAISINEDVENYLINRQNNKFRVSMPSYEELGISFETEKVESTFCDYKIQVEKRKGAVCDVKCEDDDTKCVSHKIFKFPFGNLSSIYRKVRKWIMFNSFPKCFTIFVRIFIEVYT